MKDMPSLTFSVGGHTLSLPPDAYIGKVVDEAARGTAGFLSLPAPPPGRRHTAVGSWCWSKTRPPSSAPCGSWACPSSGDYYTTFDVGGNSGLQRSIFVSLADPKCEPAKEEAVSQGGPALLGSKVAARSVNASRLALPGWARAAARRGFLSI
ncbi:unnamed protein product [Prorocentrum cordatum]|uniref:Subtilisin n=1 Tax=Prorocentrum cordatum TaxID=2364126 RepID=A0ABN9XSS8_9DINO|nr:unnamed protein product [Polarella glacialis]